MLTEDSLSWGYGAELAARIGETHYTELDGPVHDLRNATPYLFTAETLARAAEGIERLLPEVSAT